MDNKITTEASRDLRVRQTEAEKILWFKLRAKQLNGIKFRRQAPIGNYIVDFVSFENNLILEIDGDPHRKSSNKRYDTLRTQRLQEEGFTVLRFWNNEITSNINGVLEKIKKVIEK